VVSFRAKPLKIAVSDYDYLNKKKEILKMFLSDYINNDEDALRIPNTVQKGSHILDHPINTTPLWGLVMVRTWLEHNCVETIGDLTRIDISEIEDRIVRNLIQEFIFEWSEKFDFDLSQPHEFTEADHLKSIFSEFPAPRGIAKGEHSIASITIEDYCFLLIFGKIVGYDKNRGGKPLNSSKIKSWFKEDGSGIDVNALSEFLIGDCGDYYQLITHHHRSSLLMHAFYYASEEQWNRIKDEKVNVRIVSKEEMLTLYCKTDDMSIHQKAGYITNCQMAIGSVISITGNGLITNYLSDDSMELFRKTEKFCCPLGTIIYAYNKAKNGKYYPDQFTMYQERNNVRDLIKCPLEGNEHEVSFSSATIKEVASVIDDYTDFHLLLKEEIKARHKLNKIKKCNPTKEFEQILRSSSFFAFYMQDRLVFKKMAYQEHSGGPYKLVPNEDIVAAIFGNIVELHEPIKLLWNSDGKSVNNRVDKIVEIICNHNPPKRKRKRRILNSHV